jgi:hypothetical protein
MQQLGGGVWGSVLPKHAFEGIAVKDMESSDAVRKKPVTNFFIIDFFYARNGWRFTSMVVFHANNIRKVIIITRSEIR